jgi:hypothetical protein
VQEFPRTKYTVELYRDKVKDHMCLIREMFFYGSISSWLKPFSTTELEKNSDMVH